MSDPRSEYEFQVSAWYLVIHRERFSDAQVTHRDFVHEPWLAMLWEEAQKRESEGQDWQVLDILPGGLSAAMESPNWQRLDEALVRSPVKTIVDAEKRVQEQGALWRATADAGRLSGKLKANELTLEDAMATAERIIQTLQTVSDDSWVSLRDAVKGAAEDALTAFKSEGKPGEGRTIPMRVKALQEATGGFAVGRMHLVMAVTSGHKTTFTRESAVYAAEQGIRASLIELEDPAKDIASRTISDRSQGMPGGGITTREFSGNFRNGEQTARELIRATDQLYQEDLPLEIYEGALSADQVVAKIYDAANRGSRLVVVDFLQLIERGRSRLDYTEFWKETANRLRVAAKRADVALVVAVQCTHEATKRVLAEGGFPGMGDVLGGAAVHQASFAFLSLGFVLEGDKGQQTRVPDLIEIVPLKWKNAPPGQRIRCKLNAAHDSIDDMEEHPPQKSLYS